MLNKYDLCNILGACSLSELQEVKDEVNARVNIKIENSVNSMNESLKKLRPIKNLYFTIDGIKIKVHDNLEINFVIED